MKIVFMGTPEFGCTILKELLKEHEVVLVVTQPDKLVGRKQIKEFSPVKKLALEKGIEVFQPISIRKDYEYILSFDFDLIVTAAYGQIVGTKLLFYPKYKAINVHASLLPSGRGGAPIQRCIINGDKETGVTIMYMEKGMDTGDMLAQEKLPILDTDTSESLFDKLAILGASMINKTISALQTNTINRIKQDDSKATYSYALTKDDEHLDFSRSAYLVNCQIRGLGHIGVFFNINDLNYKIYNASLDDKEYKNAENGEIVEVSKKYFKVKCGDNLCIIINQIKPEGKNLMNVSDFLNGKGKEVLLKGTILK